MAPSVDIEVVQIIPWPLFTAIKDGMPAIGAKLYTYAAGTSTPKASYADPYLLVPNVNPTVCNDQGQAVVYLDGFYKLVLKDHEDVILWEIDHYEFPSSSIPPPGGGIFGVTDGTAAAANGESVIAVPTLVPLGYRVEGVIVRIDTAFGSSQGLQAIQIGDATLQDGWGEIALDAGLTTGQQHFRRGDRPIAALPYTVLLAAIGGRFDSTGSLSIKAFWSSIGGWS